MNSDSKARKIKLNELPRWSPHVAALLRGDSMREFNRDREFTTCNYTKVYGSLLDTIGDGRETIDLERIRRAHHGRPNSFIQEGQRCVSIKDDLYLMSVEDADAQKFDLFCMSAAGTINECVSVVDLGAGYGYLLSQLMSRFPGPRQWIGADGSAEAVEIAERAFQHRQDVRFYPFDFYDANTYHFLETAPAPVLVMTSHAIEQLPSAKIVLDTLTQYRDRIHHVIHFEPVYRPNDDTILGAFRRQYVETMDYNRDLLFELQQRPEIQLIRDEPNVIGLNPLNPSSIIEWKFVS